MSREPNWAGQRAPTDPYYDHGDRLNELWVEWVNMVLELKLDAVVRCPTCRIIRVARMF